MVLALACLFIGHGTGWSLIAWNVQRFLCPRIVVVKLRVHWEESMEKRPRDA